MAFGIPNSGDLNGLADKLAAIVTNLGPEEQAVVSAAVTQLSEHGSALISQAGDTILKVESSAISQFEEVLNRQRTAFFAELDSRLNGLTLTNRLVFPPAAPVSQAMAAKS